MTMGDLSSITGAPTAPTCRPQAQAQGRTCVCILRAPSGRSQPRISSSRWSGKSVTRAALLPGVAAAYSLAADAGDSPLPASGQTLVLLKPKARRARAPAEFQWGAC